jgi:uncharacterized protein (TIGR00369 family)
VAEGEINSSWVTQSEGEFAGWMYWPSDNWESNGGPFYFRKDEDGTPRCAFRAQAKHMNGQGHMHGGALMTFADFSMWGIGADAMGGEATVTVTMAFEFLSAVQKGDLVEAAGEVVKSGRRMIFLRGIVTANGKPVLNYSGSVMRMGS